MPRDQKIGLALGILLMGAVGAFFFRHEEARIEPLPVLKSAAELDRQIASQQRAPYLLPEEPTAPPPRPITADETLPPDGAGLVPEPIAGLDEPLFSAGTTTDAGTGVGPEKRHTVQRGETLSSLAAKYLGSANRFEEIYQANTDRLRNPNDVQPGMELRIPAEKVANRPSENRPATNGETPAPRMATRPEAATGSAPSDSSPRSGTKLFEPYRRSPLSPSESGTDARPASGKRLSVTPPRDGNVIR